MRERERKRQERGVSKERKRVIFLPDPVFSAFSTDLSLFVNRVCRRWARGGKRERGAATKLSFRVSSRSRSRSRLEEEEENSTTATKKIPHYNLFFSSFFVSSFPLFSLRDGLHDLRLRPRWPRDGHQPQERHGAPFLLPERGEIRPRRCPPISPLWRRRGPRRARAAADAASVSLMLVFLYLQGQAAVFSGADGLREPLIERETKTNSEQTKDFLHQTTSDSPPSPMSSLFSRLSSPCSKLSTALPSSVETRSRCSSTSA